MDPKVKAILDEARQRLWKVAEDFRVAEKDRDLASILGDLLEDIGHCGFGLTSIELESGATVYAALQPIPPEASKGILPATIEDVAVLLGGTIEAGVKPSL